MIFRSSLGLCLVLAVGCSSSSTGVAGDGAGADEGGGDAQGGAPADGGATSDGGAEPIDPCAGFATEVVEVAYGPGAGFGQDDMPGIVLGAPAGGGLETGSLDVVALGNGGSITLGFGAQTIVDGDGPDFIVFENAFDAGGDPTMPFAELATVQVSADGATWVEFPCTASEYPYGACAGWHPVLAGDGDPTIDPHDPEAAGGDAFDLADVGLSEARFIRIVDRPDTIGLSGSFDLDAVALAHFTCDAP